MIKKMVIAMCSLVGGSLLSPVYAASNADYSSAIGIKILICNDLQSRE